MRFFGFVMVLSAFLNAKEVSTRQDKPQVLHLKPGPVRDALKRNYRLYLVRDFQAEADREIKKKMQSQRQ